VLGLVLGESVLLLLIGGVIGMALATVIAPAVSKGSGGMVQLPSVGTGNWIEGIIAMVVIGALVGAFPALRGMRLKIVDALAGR
jgi:putative ABC transport system permease protein